MSRRDETTNILNYAPGAAPSRLRSPRFLLALNVVIVLSVLLAASSIISTIYFAYEGVDLTLLATSLFMVLCILVPASTFQIVLLATAPPRVQRDVGPGVPRRSMVISGLAVLTIAISTVLTLKPAIIHAVIKLLP